MSKKTSYKASCPNLSCNSPQKIKKDGFYFRKNDSRKVQRFKCLSCGKKFSRSTSQLEYYQKKRRVNHLLFKLLVSGVSQRRAALVLRINKNTVTRKFYYLAKKYSLKNRVWLQQIKDRSIFNVQVDDLITTEHTKLKPLTVCCAVNPQTREILGAKVGRIPAFGLLAEKSRKKYGKRENEHPKVLKELFCEISEKLSQNTLIQSDDHKLYPHIFKLYLPHAQHQTYRGERSCVSGQGELKRVYYDPLFAINHTYAMLRANINRLVRRTWCTTKIKENLQRHLEMYIWYHNHILIKQ